GMDVSDVLHQPGRPLHPYDALSTVGGVSLLLLLARAAVFERQGRVATPRVRLRVVSRLPRVVGRGRVRGISISTPARRLELLPAVHRGGLRPARLSIRQSFRPVARVDVAGGMVRGEGYGAAACLSG